MATVFLVRHGLTAQTGSVLSGRTPGRHLSQAGLDQARATAERISAVPVHAIVTSPLERCVQTAQAIVDAQRAAGREPEWALEEELLEVDYGRWTGRRLTQLAKDPMWPVVQQQPSAARFPDGEGLADAAARAVAAVRRWDARFGADAVWVACSHGDLIKAVLADALGTHLDQFQRVVVDPASVSVIRYTPTRPFVLRSNDIGGSLEPFAPKAKRRRHRTDDAAIGGGTGAA
jgi:probable phosphomutase (TIGR03848 family)